MAADETRLILRHKWKNAFGPACMHFLGKLRIRALCTKYTQIHENGGLCLSEVHSATAHIDVCMYVCDTDYVYEIWSSKDTRLHFNEKGKYDESSVKALYLHTVCDYRMDQYYHVCLFLATIFRKNICISTFFIIFSIFIFYSFNYLVVCTFIKR